SSSTLKPSASSARASSPRERRACIADVSDEEIRRRMAESIEATLDERWPEIDEMWMREIRPLFGDRISDEDFVKRISTPLSMRLLSIGIQAGILGIASN